MTMSAIERYNKPPENTGSSATHFVHFPWYDDWNEDSWQSIPELEVRSLSGQEDDLVTKDCADLYDRLPGADGSRVITRLSHKSLVVVERERVGPNGEYHYVKVVDTNPEVDGLEGYVDYERLEKLPGVAYSLPVVFKCKRNHDKNRDFCSLSEPQWFTTTEPYLDTFECQYKINIVTNYTETGGDSALKARMKEQIPVAVGRLLEYYDKVRSSQQLDNVLGAFKFAEAVGWNLDLTDPNSRLKVLVSVPARYFDALPDSPSNLSSTGELVERHATLTCSTVDRDIERLAGKMRSWGSSYSWQKNASTYSGPEPFYKEFNFEREARRLESFLSKLRRLLVLNGKGIRKRSQDTIELGMTREYELVYVLLTDDTGSHKMRVGLNALKKIDPFNNPRTLAYIFFLFEITNEFNTSNGIKGGWPVFLKKFTFPPPDHRPSSNKRCKPTLSDPLKCMPKEFQEFRKKHLEKIKCEDLPAEFKTTPLDLGASEVDQFYEAVSTGEWSGYEDRYATFKEQATNMISKKDIKKFKQKIREENAQFEGSLDFVGDPFVDQLYDNLDKYSAESFSSDVFDKFMEDVVVKIDIKDLISNLHQCFCEDQRRLIDSLIEELEDRDHPTVRAAELASSAAGCDNPCEVLPILCSCLPIPWPLKFDIPSKFSIPDILAYVSAAILDAIIAAAFKFLLDLIKGFISQSFDCRRKSRKAKNFTGQFESNYPFDDDTFDADDVEKVLRENSMPPELIDVEKINQLISDTVLLLSPREFCQLISGEPSLAAMEAVSFLVNERYPEFSQNFNSHEKIRSLYASIGDLIDPDICRGLDEILNSIPIEPGNYICDQTTVREDIANGRASREQINSILTEASRCNGNKLGAISDLVNNLVAGNDPIASLLPDIFITPANPNGILERDPPPVKFATQQANNAVFGSIERSFYSEMNSNVPTLVTTIKRELDPNSIGPNSSPSLQFLKTAGVDLNKSANTDLLRVLDKTIANGLGRILRSQVGTATDYDSENSLISLELPPRNVYAENIFFGKYGPGDNFYTKLPVPGFSVDEIEAEPIRRERIRVEYDICGETAATVNWNRVRDAYSVRIQDTINEDNEGGSFDLMTFDGKKKIKDDIVDLYEDFRTSGNFSPSRELFSNVISNQWLTLPLGAESKDLLLNASSPLNAFHSARGFKYVTTDIISRMAKFFSKASILDSGEVDFLGDYSGETSFEDAFENLKSIRFVPDYTCDPVEPGILNMDDLMEAVSEAYDNDLENDPAKRYINSAKFGLASLLVRVFAIHTVMNSIFTFTQFKAENILESDLLVSYLLNKFRADMSRNFIVQNPNFYRHIKATVGVNLAKRKYVDQEDFKDPFSSEPVDVRLDPTYVRMLVESTQHDPTGLIETIDLEEVEDQELQYESENIESVLNCYVAGVDDFVSVGISECVPQSQSDGNNESSDGTAVDRGADEVINDEEVAQPNVGAGKRPIGFMEFFFREQLKSISGEIEVMLGSENNDLDRLMINGLSRTTSAPSFYRGSGVSNSQTPRFFKSLDFGQDILTRERVQAAGLGGVLEVYDLIEEAGGRSGVLPKSKIDDLFTQGRISRELRDRYVRDAKNTIEALNLIAEDLIPTVDSVTEGYEISQSTLLNPEFSYLKTGGFVTERYIRVEDLTEDEWLDVIEEGPSTRLQQFLYEKIKNRHSQLKGVVSLKDWQQFLNELKIDVENQLGPVGGGTSKALSDIDKYYRSWKMGKRVSYVYPLSDRPDRLNSVRRGVDYRDNLRETTRAANSASKRRAKKEKAYFLSEEVGVSLNISDESGLALLSGETITSSRTYEYNLVPVVVSELELDSSTLTTLLEDNGGYNKLLGMDAEDYGIMGAYEQAFEGKLETQLIGSSKYKALFDYVFPLDRFVALLTIYTAEHVSALPGRETLFDRTKELISDAFESLQQSGRDDWWERKERKHRRWEKPLDLSVPAILFLTPWKILQALVTLVPPLDWLLGKIKKKIPALPPYRDNKVDSCPEDRAE